MSDVNQKDLDAEIRFKEMGGKNISDLFIAAHGNATRVARILGVQWRTVNDVYGKGLLNVVIEHDGGLELLTKTQKGRGSENLSSL